jgi:glycosyltransferase involved in cell wall biosynthesis
MSSRLVSIIIPLYNGEPFIEATIHSVLEQTYQNIEIIVLDDGSSDNSARIVKTFSDEKIRYVLNETNLGLNQNIKKGIELANGEYICLLGHDDLYVKDKLEKQITYIEENNLDGVYAACFILHKEGTVTEQLCNHFDQKVKNKDSTLMNDIYIPDCKVSLPMSQSALFKRVVLKALNPLRDKVRLDDWPILVKTFEHYNMGFINEPMFYWRQHDNNMYKNIWYNMTISVEALSEVIPQEMRMRCFANNINFMSGHFASLHDTKTALKLCLASFCLNPSKEKFKSIYKHSRRLLKETFRKSRKIHEKKIP